MLAHLAELVTAEKMHELCLYANEKADMPFPTRRIVSRKHYDTTRHRLF